MKRKIKFFVYPLAVVLMSLFVIVGCSDDDPDPINTPTLTTLDVTEITETSAKSGGDITDDGGGEITARGVVWNTTSDLSVDNHKGKTSDGVGAGNYISIITDLEPGINYYLRSYASNSGGTGYGEIVSFKTFSSGDADLEKFVSVGGAFTAGFMDGELFREGQKKSLANIIAGQLMQTGLSSFKQPLMKDELGFGNRLVLAHVDGFLMPVSMPGTPNPGNYENIFQTDGPFHNLGVPGASIQHLLFEGYATLNPYYHRFAADISASSILGDALALNPSFFSLWIGINDILLYAVNGGEGPNILPPEDFSTAYHALVQQLSQNGALGVTANIPNITQIPFFTTVPFNALLLGDSDVVDMLNTAYAEAPHISFDMGSNPLVVIDQDHPVGIRQLESDELVLLTALDSIRNQGWGSDVPISPEYYLNTHQIELLSAHVAAYNDIISLTAAETNLAMVCVKQFLQNAEVGIYFDENNLIMAFIEDGVFSIDALHLTPRGNAILANKFISAINQQYNAYIPKSIIDNYQGIEFP